MKRPFAALAAIVVSVTLALASPVAAFTLVEANSFFDVFFTFERPVVTDGGKQLQKRMPYKVHVAAMGDGSVRASFFDSTGHNAGEARGIIAVLKQGAAVGGAGGAQNEEKWQKADTSLEHKHKIETGGQTALSFAKLGFTNNSRTSLKTEGQSAKLEILSTDGGHSILIGLLLPAVQKAPGASTQPH